jgi:hypothetical protein
VLTAAIRWSTELGVDSDVRAEWAHTLRHLEPFATAVDNATGNTVYIFADDDSNDDGSDGGGGGGGVERSEGHGGGGGGGGVARPGPAVAPVFPSGVIGLDSDPDVLEMARNTAELIVSLAGGLSGRACWDWPAVIRVWRASNATWLLQEIAHR